MFISVGASTWWVTPSRSVILIFTSLIFVWLTKAKKPWFYLGYNSIYGFDHGLGSFPLAAVKAAHPAHGGVLHHIFFIGMDPLIGTLAHQGGLVEPTKDQFQLPGIGVHIPDGIDPGHIGTVVQGIVHHQGILFNVKAPIGQGSQFWGQAEERDEMVHRNFG